MAECEKRKAPGDAVDLRPQKRSRRQFNSTKAKDRVFNQAISIEPGDSGIFATCNRGKEPKCVVELKNVFEEYAEKIYRPQKNPATHSNGLEVEEVDIEAEIKSEVNDLQRPTKKPLFQNVRLDVQCVLFLKTTAPVEPEFFVHTICQDASQSGVKKTRFAKRLTPISMVGHASEKGLENASLAALAPHFHKPDNPTRKFAIRSNIRNHNKILSQDKVIKIVAPLVGPKHSVDLKHYDLLILVEVYTNICGVSVVGNDFERLRRFNLMEIQGETLKQSSV